MTFLGIGKKKERPEATAKQEKGGAAKPEVKGCSCGGACTEESMAAAEQEKDKAGIKILGGGCSKCDRLEAAARKAMTELGIDEEIEHVRDFEKIAAYGVMTTPALVVDGKVVSYGKVLSAEEAAGFIEERRGKQEK